MGSAGLEVARVGERRVLLSGLRMTQNVVEIVRDTVPSRQDPRQRRYPGRSVDLRVGDVEITGNDPQIAHARPGEHHVGVGVLQEQVGVRVRAALQGGTGEYL